MSGLWKVRKPATHDPPWAQLSSVTQLRPISNTHSSDLSSNPAEGEEREQAIWNLLQFSESQSTYPAWRVKVHLGTRVRFKVQGIHRIRVHWSRLLTK